MYDIVWIESNNKRSRNGMIPISIIIHAIGTTLAQAIDILKGLTKVVSAHYLVPQITGEQFIELYPEYALTLKYPSQVPVIAFVPEEETAFHAGISRWRNWNDMPGCDNSLNNCSIGIEFHSPGYAKGDDSDMFYFTSFTTAQMETGSKLVHNIRKRWHINSFDVLAHSDISFMRPDGSFKTDPGPLFPWNLLLGKNERLKNNNVDRNIIRNEVEWVQQKLYNIGYSCLKTGALDEYTRFCINAYRMRFMQNNWQQFDGSIDQNLINSLHPYEQTNR